MTKKIWTMGVGASAIAGITTFTVGGISTYTQIVGGFALIVGLLGMVILIRRGKE